MLAVLFLLLLPVKGILYFALNRFKFRVRTSLLSLSLFNYSEFGLIVGGLAFKMGWCLADIFAAVAIAVSLSFLIAAPLNKAGHKTLSTIGEVAKRTRCWEAPPTWQTNWSRSLRCLFWYGPHWYWCIRRATFTLHGKSEFSVEVREDAVKIQPQKPWKKRYFWRCNWPRFGAYLRYSKREVSDLGYALITKVIKPL